MHSRSPDIVELAAGLAANSLSRCSPSSAVGFMPGACPCMHICAFPHTAASIAGAALAACMVCGLQALLAAVLSVRVRTCMRYDSLRSKQGRDQCTASVPPGVRSAPLCVVWLCVGFCTCRLVFSLNGSCTFPMATALNPCINVLLLNPGLPPSPSRPHFIFALT